MDLKESSVGIRLNSMVGSILIGEGGSQVSCSEIRCDHSETFGISETKEGRAT